MSDSLQHSLRLQENSLKESEELSLAGVKMRSLPKIGLPISEVDQKLLEEHSQIDKVAIERSPDPKIQVENIYSFIEKTVSAPHITALLKQISKSQFRSVRRFISSGEGAPILSLFESKNKILNNRDDSTLFASEDTDAKPLGILNRIINETATLLRVQTLENYFGISAHSPQEVESRYSALYLEVHETSSSRPDHSTIAKNMLARLMVEFRKKGGKRFSRRRYQAS